MNDDSEFIRETDEEWLPISGELTGWEVVIFEVVDEEEPSD